MDIPSILMTSIKYLGLGLSLSLIPGPILFELVRRTLRSGIREGMLLITGDLLANCSIFVVTYLGLHHLSNQASSTDLFRILLAEIGGLILVLLGINAWFAPRPASNKQKQSRDSIQEALFVGFIMAVSSPLSIFALAGVSGAVAEQHDTMAYGLMALSALALGIWLGYGIICVIISAKKRHLSDQLVILISKVSSVLLIGFGFYFFSLIMGV